MEVFYEDQWGTVCNDHWDMNDAKVVCGQLGYNYTVRVILEGNVPLGSGQIWLDNVNCTGSEQNLSSCVHNGWGIHDCDHDDDAGVVCSSTGNCLTLNFLSYLKNSCK